VAWKGDNSEMMSSNNEILDDFVYASKLMKRLRNNK